MSHLIDHARATRHLANAFDAKARMHAFDKAAPVLRALSDAYADAARRMEEDARKDAVDHACSLDHRTQPTPRCAACGAPRG